MITPLGDVQNLPIPVVAFKVTVAFFCLAFGATFYGLVEEIDLVTFFLWGIHMRVDRTEIAKHLLPLCPGAGFQVLAAAAMVQLPRYHRLDRWAGETSEGLWTNI
jgi:hypothetical protein